MLSFKYKNYLLFLFLFGLYSCSSNSDLVEITFDNLNNSKSTPIFAEVAANDHTRSFGLMYRREMADDRGMLFVFSKEAPQSFWMKNTYLSLDIIFLDKSLTVLNVVENATPLSTTARSSIGLSQYVLEIKGGLASKNGISKGSKALIKGDLPPAQ